LQAWVPLPAPGGPNNTIFNILFLIFLDVIKSNKDSLH